MLRAVQDSGMWIGNHSFTHAHLTGLASGPLSGEIADTQEAVASLTGTRPSLFRPSYGETDSRVRAAVADAIVHAAETVVPGGIILMHDSGYQTTVDAVPRILRVLARRGLQPGSVTS